MLTSLEISRSLPVVAAFNALSALSVSKEMWEKHLEMYTDNLKQGIVTLKAFNPAVKKLSPFEANQELIRLKPFDRFIRAVNTDIAKLNATNAHILEYKIQAHLFLSAFSFLKEFLDDNANPKYLVAIGEAQSPS